jgi:transposase
MFTLSAAVRIYVAAAPCDLRRGFDGLSALMRSVIGADPMSGHLFVFLNMRRDRIRMLAWGRSGYVVVHKDTDGAPPANA